MNIRSALGAALLVCLAANASAQTPATPEEDDRTQYPGFMANSFFTFSVGSIGYLFGERQLNPGYLAEAVIKPRLSVRVDLFGHQFTKYFSMQATYLRPTRFIEYRNVNGTTESFQVSNAYAGVSLALHLPLTNRIGAFGEGGGGVTSRSGITFEHKVALAPAHYTSGLLGAGLDIRASQNID